MGRNRNENTESVLEFRFDVEKRTVVEEKSRGDGWFGGAGGAGRKGKVTRKRKSFMADEENQT